MLGAKFDFNRDFQRRAGVDDMVKIFHKKHTLFYDIFLFIQVFMSKNTDSEISHNLKIRFDVNCIYVIDLFSLVILQNFYFKQ